MSIWEHDDGLRSSTRRTRIVKVDDSKSQQRVDLRGLKNEKPKKIWHLLPFGFTTNPPKDSDGLIEQMGSRSDRTIYRDGGHEKYRPKKTPEGCMAIFNQFGDIVRVFKENADVVHQKKINIRVGHGYKAGDSGDSGGDEGGDDSPDDTSDQDNKTISVVMDGNSIVITYQQAKVTLNETSLTTEFADSSAKLESGKITLTSPHVIVKSDHVDLGAEGGTPVGLCGGGCATKVFAV